MHFTLGRGIPLRPIVSLSRSPTYDLSNNVAELFATYYLIFNENGIKILNVWLNANYEMAHIVQSV